MINIEQLIVGMMFPIGLAFGLFCIWFVWCLYDLARDSWLSIFIPISAFLLFFALVIWGIK